MTNVKVLTVTEVSASKVTIQGMHGTHRSMERALSIALERDKVSRVMIKNYYNPSKTDLLPKSYGFPIHQH